MQRYFINNKTGQIFTINIDHYLYCQENDVYYSKVKKTVKPTLIRVLFYSGNYRSFCYETDCRLTVKAKIAINKLIRELKADRIVYRIGKKQKEVIKWY